MVLSNLGRFSNSDRAASLRVAALYLLLNAELEPGIAIGTADGRIGVSLTFDATARPEWFEQFENLIRSMATVTAC